MQNNDGTWSHKPGPESITSLSLGANRRILTNTNLYSKANKGKYSNGNLRFFVITKKAELDNPHTSREAFWPYSYNNVSTMVASEKAGDYMENAVQVIPGNHSCKIDFNYDEDYFFVPISSTQAYTIKPISGVGTIKCTVMTNTGNVLGTCYSSSSTGITLNLNAGSQYYIKTENINHAPVSYTLSIY